MSAPEMEESGWLRQLGLLDESSAAHWTPLDGGVSSDIWRVDLPDRVVCVKRARPVLAVAAEWNAPVERNESEVGWLEVAAKICPTAVPRVLGHLPDQHLFVMEYLDPDRYPVWKSELAAGRTDHGLAREVGRMVGEIHSQTAGDQALASRFATDALFQSLRIEPYFLATAEVHSDLAPQLSDIADRTAHTRKALVHGDVSPKNILAGPKGPVLLDAECAWFGDPAFDVAFCLSHLLLKCVWVPDSSESFILSAREFSAAYAERVDWERADDLDDRVGTMIPALLLARIDGKSPVEYLTDEDDRESVRSFARELLAQPEHSANAVIAAWQRSLPN